MPTGRLQCLLEKSDYHQGGCDVYRKSLITTRGGGGCDVYRTSLNTTREVVVSIRKSLNTTGEAVMSIGRV